MTKEGGQMNIGQAMRETREDFGLTLTQLSEMSGVPISTICSYEIGRMIPGVHNLIALADALETSIDDYIGHRI